MRRGRARGSLFVELSGFAERIPLGVMGDGMWRMFAISVALANCANGLLLVDDIDTGLHHTVMDRMWRLISQAAQQLNVQVFATTHSRDCFESLAVICTEAPHDSRAVSIQRLERDREMAVGYDEAEILAVARRGLEVR